MKSFFTALGFFKPEPPALPEIDPPVEDLVIDLRAFTCGHTKLGAAPDERDFFASPLQSSNRYDLERLGLTLDTKDGALDCIYLTLGQFRGRFTHHGNPLSLPPETTPTDIAALFGESYWIDTSDHPEVIVFYEFDGGAVELQFEYSGEDSKLSIITLCRHGVLSDAEQRESYGVTKPWPPA